jgi:hypothetical protein
VLARLRFGSPRDLSPFVADLHRWWYRQQGIAERALIVSPFILMDPHTELRGHGVPFWAMFNTEPAAQALDDYLAGAAPFERLGMMLFAHGSHSVGLAPIERWRELLCRARQGQFLGVSERAYPGDFAAFARYQPALAEFLPSREPSPLLTLGELLSFAQAYGTSGVEWVEQEDELGSAVQACAHVPA